MKQNKLEQQSRETQRGIMEAADHLFFTQGYQETSVEDICRAAGVTKGAFYHHFRGKDVVYRRCFIPRLDRYLAEHYHLQSGAGAAQRFSMLAACTFASSRECGRELTAQSIIGLLTEHESRLYEVERTHTRLLREACAAAMAEKLFPPEMAEDTLIMLYACLMNGFLVKWAGATEEDDRTIDWNALLDMEIALFTAGYREHA